MNGTRITITLSFRDTPRRSFAYRLTPAFEEQCYPTLLCRPLCTQAAHNSRALSSCLLQLYQLLSSSIKVPWTISTCISNLSCLFLALCSLVSLPTSWPFLFSLSIPSASRHHFPISGPTLHCPCPRLFLSAPLYLPCVRSHSRCTVYLPKWRCLAYTYFAMINRSVHFPPRQRQESDKLITEPRIRLLIPPRLAAHTAGFRFLSHNFACALPPTSSVYCRSPCIYVLQFNSQPPAIWASEYCGTTCPPCPDRLPRKRRCRSRFILDKCIKCVGCTQSNFLSGCAG